MKRMEQNLDEAEAAHKIELLHQRSIKHQLINRINKDSTKIYHLIDKLQDEQIRCKILTTQLIAKSAISDLSTSLDVCKLCEEKNEKIFRVCEGGHILCFNCLFELLTKQETIYCPFCRREIWDMLYLIQWQ
jgi:hypothetical protein